MSPRSTHAQTTLTSTNFGTLTDPKRVRKPRWTEVRFTTFGMTDVGVEVIPRICNNMKRKLTLVHIQAGNGTMVLRVHDTHHDAVTNILNDLIDGVRNADIKVPPVLSNRSPRQRPQRRVPIGRSRR